MSEEHNDHVTEEEEMEGTFAEMTQPIIIDLGKQKRKKLKALKKGKGALLDEIYEVMDEVRELLGEEADGKLMVPVVLLYEKKNKRNQIEKLLFPLAK